MKKNLIKKTILFAAIPLSCFFSSQMLDFNILVNSAFAISPDLIQALYRRDFDYILGLRDTQTWNNLSTEDLSSIPYTLFQHALIYNNPIETEKGKELIRSLFLLHPKAEVSVNQAASLLGYAMGIGNSSIAEFIKEEHPCWADITAQQLAYILKENLTVGIHPGGNNVDFSMDLQIQGKQEILDLILAHPNFNTTDVKYLRTYIKSILRSFILPENKTFYLQHFSTYFCWDQITNYDIAYYLSSHINFLKTEDIILFQEHPNWNTLNHWNLTKMALTAVSNYSNEEEITPNDLLFIASNHPNWPTLSTYELFQITYEVLSRNSNKKYLPILSQHPNWNNLSLEELINSMESIALFSSSPESMNILYSHPSWPFIKKSMMVRIAVTSLKHEKYDLFDRVTKHPAWQQFTHYDLQNILRAANNAVCTGRFCEKIEEIKDIVFSHPNWEGNIETIQSE